MTLFSKYNLNEVLNKSLKSINFTTPTPIQEKSIPLILQGKDILGSAQTGTGKTAAFCIPILELLMKSPRGSLLVMIPTRELAKQVLDVINSLLGFKSSINTATLIGGESMSKQLSQLKKRPRIYVGTPGRINDHLQRGSLNLHDAKYLVLDETDRMLDMGFEVQINKIIKYLPVSKQVLMFSATIPNNILKLSSKYLNDPVRISVGESNTVAKNIKQEIIELKSDEKLDELINQITNRNGSILIFVKTKYGTEKLSKALSRSKIKSFPLHGGLRQSKRNTIMKNFRDMKFRILIATDVAARGIDVPHIEHVINYDLPQMAEDFIHRIGRTARAGSKGIALSFVTKGDFAKWKAIQKILNPEKNLKNQNKSNNKNKRTTFKKKSDYKKSSDQKEKKYSKDKRSRKSYFEKREDNKRSTFKKKSDYKKSSDQKEKKYSKDKRSRKSYSEKREDNKRSTFKKKSDYKKSSDQKEKKYSKNKFKKNKISEDFNSDIKIKFSRKNKINGSPNKKKSLNKNQNNATRGDFQRFNSPRKRRNNK